MHSIEFENQSAVGSADGAASVFTPTKTHEDFDFDSIDSEEDQIRQMLKDGATAEEIVRKFGRGFIEREVEKGLCVILAIIQRHERPMFFLDQLCWHIGVALSNGQSVIDLARKYGISKQAFTQATKRSVKKLCLPKKSTKTRTQRDLNARQNMRAAYTKPNRPTLKIPFLE
jgi:hypothetical protein